MENKKGPLAYDHVLKSSPFFLMLSSHRSTYETVRAYFAAEVVLLRRHLKRTSLNQSRGTLATSSSLFLVREPRRDSASIRMHHRFVFREAQVRFRCCM